MPVSSRQSDDGPDGGVGSWLAGAHAGLPGDLLKSDIVAAVAGNGGRWTNVTVQAQVASTNTEAMAAAAAGAATGTAFVADEQTAGRGRMARTWVAPPGTSAMLSVLLRPPAQRPQAAPGTAVLPLLAGVAVVEAVAQVSGLGAVLKWPNDVLVGPAGGVPQKFVGILAERDPAGAVVLGIGINVSTARDQLPVPTATSLALAGAQPFPRAVLVGATLARLEHWFDAWSRATGDVLGRYRELCVTIGSDVEVARPDGTVLEGRATGVGPGGELLVDAGGTITPLVAGDVTHVRPSRGKPANP